MSGPLVYKSINSVMRDLNRTGISKEHTNKQDQYKYRSIDDVLNRLSPLLVKHRLCVLPRALDRITVDRNSRNSALLVSVSLKQAFDIVSTVDQSFHTVEAWGEALDAGDKGTSKAMSAAYKAAMLQTFCIPVVGMDDADARGHRLKTNSLEPEPVQGWTQWVADITAIIAVCDSGEALSRIQDTNRSLLNGLRRERHELYGEIGKAFESRRIQLGSASATLAVEQRNGRPTSNGSSQEPVVHA